MVVADPIFYKTVELMSERLERIENALKLRDDDALQPLARILGISASAARKRIERDAGLAALGVPVGSSRRLHFRPSEVQSLGRAKGRHAGVPKPGAVK